MRISERRVLRTGDTVEVSAEIDGFRLWYRVPAAFPVSEAADPFAAAALLPAMLEGRGLEAGPGLTLSPRLIDNWRTLQEIYHRWNPVFKIVPIRAAERPAEPLARGVLSFFSGGVDSTYTFLKRREELTHLAFIQGFDFLANPGGAGAFTVDDLADLSLFAFNLNRPRNGVSIFLRGSLSPRTLEILAAGPVPWSMPAGFEARLAAEIDRLLAGPSIWEGRRFAGVALRPATRQLLDSQPRGESLYRLNRLLLEDACPQEIARRDDSVYRTAVERNGRFAAAAGKTLVPVSTNHYAFGYRFNLSRNLTQGSALASVALVLGFPRAYMPGAYAYHQLMPLGQHPLTDPLWSNEAVELVHDGAEARRVDKLVKVAGNAAALQNLRVCFDDMNENCGRCAKCLRTMVPLARMGVSGAPFPPLPPLRALRRMPLGGEIERTFFEENLDPALGTANPPLDRALRACLRRYERQKLLRTADRALLGGSLWRAYQRRAAPSTGILRIDTTPPPWRPRPPRGQRGLR
jgi:hypothetical protein